MPSYSPAATWSSSDCSQYCWKPATDTFIKSFWSALLVTRSLFVLCQNHDSFMVTVG